MLKWLPFEDLTHINLLLAIYNSEMIKYECLITKKKDKRNAEWKLKNNISEYCCEDNIVCLNQIRSKHQPKHTPKSAANWYIYTYKSQTWTNRILNSFVTIQTLRSISAFVFVFGVFVFVLLIELCKEYWCRR